MRRLEDVTQSDEISGQYQENQRILDCRAVMSDFLYAPFPESNHPMHGALDIYPELNVRSAWLILSAIVNPFRKGDADIWLPSDVLGLISSFLITSSNPNENTIERFERVGDALFRPGIAKSKSLIAYHGPGYLFQPSIADVIDAIVCGNFNKPKRLLETNHNLLTQYSTATAPSGVVMENVTPLQAAILSSDTEVFEMIRELFFSQNNAAEFERQRLEIYTRRLTAFCDQMCLEADRFQTLLDAGITEDTKFGYSIVRESVASFRAACDSYQQALDSRDFQTIFDAHQKAEDDDAYYLFASIFMAINEEASRNEVKTLLFSGINVCWQETDEARVKSWEDLTLPEKIIRFRDTLKTNALNAEGLLKQVFHLFGDIIFKELYAHDPERIERLTLTRRMVASSIESQLPARTAQAFLCKFSDIAKNRQCPGSSSTTSVKPLESDFNSLRDNFLKFRADKNEKFSAIVAPPECAGPSELRGSRKRTRSE